MQVSQVLYTVQMFLIDPFYKATTDVYYDISGNQSDFYNTVYFLEQFTYQHCEHKDLCWVVCQDFWIQQYIVFIGNRAPYNPAL